MQRCGLLLLLMTSCADFADTMLIDTGAGEQADPGTADDTGSFDDQDVGYWWTLAADLQVLDGTAVVDESVLHARVQNASGASLCSMDAVITGIVAEDTPEPELVPRWWHVQAQAWEPPCEAGTVPTDLYLGVGSLHPEIIAVLDTLDDAQAGAGATLNGAYGSMDGGATVFVFGAAGPEESWSGVGEPWDGVEPMSDGTWWIRPAYSFSLASR